MNRNCESFLCPSIVVRYDSASKGGIVAFKLFRDMDFFLLPAVAPLLVNIQKS
jgi:hypothetical protein